MVAPRRPPVCGSTAGAGTAAAGTGTGGGSEDSDSTGGLAASIIILDASRHIAMPIVRQTISTTATLRRPPRRGTGTGWGAATTSGRRLSRFLISSTAVTNVARFDLSAAISLCARSSDRSASSSRRRSGKASSAFTAAAGRAGSTGFVADSAAASSASNASRGSSSP